MFIDAHQHFWIYSPEEFGWVSEEMKVLRKNFLPTDLEADLLACGYEGTVAVQARQCLEENDFLIGLASENSFIKGGSGGGSI